MWLLYAFLGFSTYILIGFLLAVKISEVNLEAPGYELRMIIVRWPYTLLAILFKFLRGRK